jgi:hypothetical protein
MGIRFDVDLDGAGAELDRLAKGPAGETVLRMEAALLAGYSASEAKVHVITGYLKSTLHPQSSFSGDTWSGTIAAARRPGIFELARGNRPTKYHPGGQHYFLGPGGQDFERAVREAVWDWVTGGEGGQAPSEGLGWKSGGDD